MRPKVLIDIKTRGMNPFSALPGRVNLYASRIVRIPVRRFLTIISLFAIGIYSVFGSVLAPVVSSPLAATAQTPPPGTPPSVVSEEERAALEKELQGLEGEIAEHESTIQELKKQGKTLQSEITTLDAKVRKLNLQIKAVELSLSRLDDEIKVNQGRIEITERDLDENKEALGKSIQEIHERGQASLIQVLIQNPTLADFFSNLNSIVEVQDGLSVRIGNITTLKTELLDEKEILGIKRSDAAALKTYQDNQKVAVQRTKEERGNLLKVTKGKESEYQKRLTETKKTAAEIRSRIFTLLGGGELTFKEAYEFARIAERATGVRAALILAVLDRESKLGQNVGRCGYKTAMHPTRDIPVFLALTSELKINPDTIMVSCANSDGAYGGAMGPAQFIPSTWKLYKDKVSEVTGNNPPSPWSNSDAFVATALYLKDAGAANANLDKERQAAAQYYAGRRWRSYLWTYGDRVVTQAQKFQADVDILNS